MKKGLFGEAVFLGLIGAGCIGLVVLFPAVALFFDLWTKSWDAWRMASVIDAIPMLLAPFILFIMVLTFWKKFVGRQEPTTRELVATAVSALIVTAILYVILQIAADFIGQLFHTSAPSTEGSGSAGYAVETTGAFGITAAAVICFLGMPNAALIAAMYGWFWRGFLIRKGIVKGQPTIGDPR